MFNIVDYFIDYKYLEDTLKNLNMMKYLWEQDLIHYVLTSFVWNNWLFERSSTSSTASSTSHKVQCSKCGRSYGKAYLPKHVCKPK